jgi:uncharacterized protein YhbP (UPF0306 family)
MNDKDALKPDICLYLSEHTTLSLATCSNNQPWATNLFYASDDRCQLYFLSGASARHSQNIEGNPHVSVTISGQYTNWRVITGLQLEGEARVVSKGDRDGVLAMYLTKFPSLKALHQASEIFALLWKSDFYGISPRWIRLIDNSKGFVHKDEVVF